LFQSRTEEAGHDEETGLSTQKRLDDGPENYAKSNNEDPVFYQNLEGQLRKPLANVSKVKGKSLQAYRAFEENHVNSSHKIRSILLQVSVGGGSVSVETFLKNLATYKSGLLAMDQESGLIHICPLFTILYFLL
jgi:hypothetical protein